MQKKHFVIVLVITLLILLIPVFGNIYVDGWNWGPMDFVFGFVMIFGTGLALVYAGKKVVNPFYKVMTLLGIIFAFLIIWGILATG
jgi:hypothetical protein